MRKKLLLSYIFIIILSGFLSVYFVYKGAEKELLKSIEKDITIQTELVSELYKKENEAPLSFVNKYKGLIDSRITLVGKDGEVLADSEDENLPNHLDRAEISSALRGIPLSRTRYSATLGVRYFYYAAPLKAGEVAAIRLSMPLDSIEVLTDNLRLGLITGVVLAALMSLLLSIFITNRLTKPINTLKDGAAKLTAGDYSKRIHITNKDQIGELADSFNEMAGQIELAMNELKGRNSTLEAILSSVDNGLLAIDKNGEIVLSNRNIEKLISLRELEGVNIWQLNLSKEIILNIREAMGSKSRMQQELHENERILALVVNPIYSREKGDEFIGLLVMLTDITQIRKLENIRKDFVSNVTHELKTPLTSIMGFVETLKSGAIENKETALRFLSIIDIEAKRLIDLINNILSISELENSGRGYFTTEYDIIAILYEVIELLKPAALKKGLELKLINNTNNTMIYCSKDKIKQLFVNLVDNAIKYTEKGSVVVEIKDADKGLEVKVEDTGVGISKEYLHRIFERFYRVEDSRSKKMGGTGLGLSIVKHIVENHGGSIDIKSEIRKGTSVSIWLPR